ncbi:MAG: ACT domain-containing protein [Anaerolineae bacterium]|jgi:hypothetical protein|nr:ACT domain-containing protein [Anaerolineae bacterium]
MTLTTREALQQTRLFSDGERYVMVKLPAAAITMAAGVLAEVGSPFSTLIVDKDEVTLIVPDEAVEEFGKRMLGAEVSESGYRLITFDVVLPPTLIGFMAAISAACARAGVSIIPLGAFSRDHILVREDQFEAAMGALKTLIEQA